MNEYNTVYGHFRSYFDTSGDIKHVYTDMQVISDPV